MIYNKHILEAITKGIKLALDDYQDTEDNSSVSQSSNVIDAKMLLKIGLNMKQI